MSRGLLLLSFSFVAGCRDVGSVGDLDAGAGTAQLPPTGSDALAVWLEGGAYRDWHCEAAPHPAREPSPHGTDRVCSNDALSAHGDGPYPVGAANVKELFDDRGALAGHAVYRRVLDGGGGESWYWFERAGGVLYADGLGGGGAPRSSCVGCHQGAGPSRFGHDLVYTQVR